MTPGEGDSPTNGNPQPSMDPNNGGAPILPIPGSFSAELAPGIVIDGFRVVRLLGQGGMGRVYLAEQISLKRMVALKVIRPDGLPGDSVRRRFQTEAEAVARVNHPGIVQVFAVGEHNGLPYMVLEFVPGRTLKQMLGLKGALEPSQVLGIMTQVARALERANEAGIVHRDIKPENILVTRNGIAKVADFGLARLKTEGRGDLHITQDGTALGTPIYMSPEQVGGKPVDIRSDIYSLGITAFHMLAGRPPFEGANAIEVALRHVQGGPPRLDALRPDIPPALVALVHRAMARKPEDRPQTPGELLSDIAKASKGISPGGPWSLLKAWGPKLAVAGAFCFSFVTVFFVSNHLWPLPPEVFPTGEDPLVELGDDPTGDKRSTALLRVAAKEYISGALKGTPSPGMAISVDLAVRYFKGNQLDQAESFFRELNAENNDISFQVLGKLGLAIVLALHNQPEESGALFRSLKNPDYQRVVRQGLLRVLVDRTPGNKAGKKDAKKMASKMGAREPLPEQDQGVILRYWLAEAVAYNRRNGRPESDLPPYLKALIADPSRPEKAP